MYEEYTIDDDIPAPRPTQDGKYGIKQLEPNQSVFVPNGVARNVRAAIVHHRKNNKRKAFVTRFVIENETPGIRVWRIR